jgi:hypothetical protein
LNYLTREVWSEIALYGAYALELDWFAFDREKNLAILTAAANAPIPVKLFASYDRFIKIRAVIDSLPKLTIAETTKEKGYSLDTWVKYAEKGLFAFDYYDEHKADKQGQYDLIVRPQNPLKLEDINIDKDLLRSFIEIDCLFFDGDIKLDLIPK